MAEFEKNEFEKENQYLEEQPVNPYIEPDPVISPRDYQPTKYLERGCKNCPQAYKTINETESASCAKLHVTDWMSKIKKPFNENNFDCVEVRFKNSHKDFFRLPDGLEISVNDVVVVEGTPGHDLGIVTLSGELCRIQMKKHKIDSKSETIRRLYRRAKTSDIEKWVESLDRENETLKKARKIATDLSLEMKLNDIEYQADNTKAIFYYTADDRVDFRNLIRILADEFKVRIEMKQIGARQEAARLGGLGTCGRELCCATWLNVFQSVSTNVAKAQQLPTNPQKLAGQCGKLKCCLNYEYDAYIDALKDFPDANIELKVKKGNAYHHKTDVFRNLMWYSFKDSSELFALSTESVKKIIEMNKKGKFPDSLNEYVEKMPEKETIDESLEHNYDEYK